jgi:hypothetical protein
VKLEGFGKPFIISGDWDNLRALNLSIAWRMRVELLIWHLDGDQLGKLRPSATASMVLGDTFSGGVISGVDSLADGVLESVELNRDTCDGLRNPRAMMLRKI